jgi:hypothetical protein
MIVWSNLLAIDSRGTEWAFIISIWLGFSIGGSLCYTVFRACESMKVRGFLISAMLIPLVIYAQYLNWVQRRKLQEDTLQVIFIYAGALVFGFLGGCGMGLLWAFQGCYTAVYAAPQHGSLNTFGSQFSTHWFIFPFIYIYTHLLSSWTISSQNKQVLIMTQAGLASSGSGTRLLMSGSSARVLLGAVRELATTSAGTKFDSLLLIFLVGTAYFWSWLPDPEDSQVNDILNPSHCNPPP